MSEPEAIHLHQFDDPVQQHEASWLGMWVFLGTEVMFFGGMFLGYTFYRTARIRECQQPPRYLARDDQYGSIDLQ
jgi:heme/copper-type cytochrome/quinol oxidase subunit 3